jgi:hypothetical protein
MKLRGFIVGVVLLGLLVPGLARAASQTVIFNDLSNPNRTLNGQYPTGVIDWGTNRWYLSGAYGAFTTLSIGFNGAGPTSAPFSFVTPRRLLQIDAYNGATGATTVTLTCAGQTTRQVTVAGQQLMTIQTSWTGTCATVTIGSSNGWDTNFDNLVIDDGNAPLISAVQASSTTSTTASVTWTTNIAANSQVEYGPTTSYGSTTPLIPSLVTSHTVDLSGLSGGTTYNYRVLSADGSGNLAVSGNFTFATASPFCTPPVSNPVACENSKPGNPASEWDLASRDAGDPSIQGFTSEFSVNKGEAVRFKVSTPAAGYRLDIYRMGYYQGNGARRVATVNPSVSLPQNQPACLVQASVGLVDCGNWAVSATWAVPSDAVSGIHFARLVRTDTGGASHVFFVVRDDAGTSPLLFQTSDTTWQAYNSYGGASLYRDFNFSLPAGRGYKVSYNRPFNTRSSISNLGPRSFVWNSEYPMVRWLEANGYNVSYFSGIDTDRRGSELLEHEVYLSVGHDEYWSGGQRANVEAARAAGVHLAFFSGNQTFWKTRWENSIDGTSTPYRTLVSYKETHANASIDPSPTTWTGTWRDPRFSPPKDGGKPENALAGQLFVVNGPQYNAMVVPQSYGQLRLWRNTPAATLGAGASLTISAGCTCLLGHEWDTDLDNGFRPAGLVRLSQTTATVPQLIQDYGNTYGSGPATHYLTLYRASSGSLVFGTGTVNWAWGLDGTHDVMASTPDTTVQQVTVNIFADMGVEPGTLRPGLVATAQSADTTAPSAVITSPTAGSSVPTGTPLTITGTASDSGGRVGAVEVSVDGGATWHPASGTPTSWTYNWTPTVLGGANVRARAADDSGNIQSSPTTVSFTVSGLVLVTFDSGLSNSNRVLNGQYPTGVIDWGTNVWYFSGPWNLFTTNSVGFNGPGRTSGTFSLVNPMRMLRVDAYNGGSSASTVTLSCAGQTQRQVTVNPGQVMTIATNWTGTCSAVSVTSSNGWDTNFDNLAFDQP